MLEALALTVLGAELVDVRVLIPLVTRVVACACSDCRLARSRPMAALCSVTAA